MKFDDLVDLQATLTQLKTSDRKAVFEMNTKEVVGKVKDWDEDYIYLQDGDELLIELVEKIRAAEKQEKVEELLEMTKKARELERN